VTLLALIRHGPTAWNAEKRTQGRTDIPLSTEGRAAVETWRAPAALTDLPIFASPLGRAQETARLLFGTAKTEPRLIEMSWGDWEGRTINELRATLGEAMTENEARGFDFRPDGGESPRDVLVRVQSWIDEIAKRADGVVAVTHLGVIRVVMAAAHDWDMLGKPPVKILPATAHLFDIATGSVRVRQINSPLQAGE
jgi:broad specificity phosphatase PhoE